MAVALGRRGRRRTQRCLQRRGGRENEEPRVGKEENGEEEVRRESRKHSGPEVISLNALRGCRRTSQPTEVEEDGSWEVSPGIHARHLSQVFEIGVCSGDSPVVRKSGLNPTG